MNKLVDKMRLVPGEKVQFYVSMSVHIIDLGCVCISSILTFD
jgi:hypothetical protein